MDWTIAIIITATITTATHPPTAIAPPISSTVAATAFAAAATQKNSRWLSQVEGNGYTLSFTYNDEGIRTSKTVNGEAHRYILNGDQIVSEQWGQHLVLYIYDADGTPIGMQYHHNSHFHRQYDVYWFEKNLQGDVVAVYDEDGDKLISYIYDAWGNFTTTYYNDCTTASTANYNPFRYRSYYYDAELEMYYLKSRYYDPEICRFINADDISCLSANGDFASYNLYAYCGNNPVSRKDDGGEFWHVLIGAVVGAAVSFTCSVVSDVLAGDEIDWGAAGISAAFGAVSGGLAATGLGPAVQIIGGAITAGAEEFAQQAYTNKGDLSKTNYAEVVSKTIMGGISSRSNGLSKATSHHVNKMAAQAKKRITNAFKHNKNSIGTLAKEFKKKFGISPKDFAKRHTTPQ